MREFVLDQIVIYCCRKAVKYEEISLMLKLQRDMDFTPIITKSKNKRDFWVKKVCWLVTLY